MKIQGIRKASHLSYRTQYKCKCIQKGMLFQYLRYFNFIGTTTFLNSMLFC
jgi:hypothetical protein